ncbi:hypothetical protein AVEN_32382-1 [Araneus ventricosus]|uniref:Uncharacterized protein n=1 Tax=Araneus ventricosus TaxID=182803 RepID=A0A4Y2PHD8_ARAVE|nr:hypothetical protein AVEN_32382-1 [Araneus ventricosus]
MQSPPNHPKDINQKDRPRYEAKPHGRHPHQAEETPTMDVSADPNIQVDIIFQVRPIGDIPSRLEDKGRLRPSALSKLLSLCVCSRRCL